MTVTIKDVAKEIGISYSSVSRALNQKEGVSEETRALIVETAKKMGYEPNDLARSLVNRKTKTVGVLVPDINNPFFCAIVTGIMEAATEKKYDVFLCISNWDIQKEQEYIKTLRKKQVDGIILKTAYHEKKVLYKELDIPVMFLESWGSNAGGNIVEVNNRKGGYLAATHLISCGYKKIGVLAGKANSYTSNERIEGYKEALSQKCFIFQEELIINGNSFSVDGGYKATEMLLKRDSSIDAIFAVNDVMALGALQYLDENKIKVPMQVGVVGFDDITYAGLPQIMLTTVSQPKEELGRIAFGTLYQSMISGANEITKKLTLEPELVVRNTTNPR